MSNTYSLDSEVVEVLIGGKTIKVDLLDAEVFQEKEVYAKDADEFIPKIRQFLIDRGAEEVSYSQAMKFTYYIAAAYEDYKKKFEGELKSAFPSTAIRLVSPNESSSSSETTSQS